MASRQEQSIHALLSDWALATEQTLGAEEAILDYLWWLRARSKLIVDGTGFVRVPRGTEELYLEEMPAAAQPIAGLKAFIFGVKPVATPPVRNAKRMRLERGRLLYILRTAERKQRRDLVGLLLMRWKYIEEVDSTMRRIWGN